MDLAPLNDEDLLTELRGAQQAAVEAPGNPPWYGLRVIAVRTDRYTAGPEANQLVSALWVGERPCRAVRPGVSEAAIGGGRQWSAGQHEELAIDRWQRAWAW